MPISNGIFVGLKTWLYDFNVEGKEVENYRQIQMLKWFLVTLIPLGFIGIMVRAIIDPSTTNYFTSIYFIIQISAMIVLIIAYYAATKSYYNLSQKLVIVSIQVALIASGFVGEDKAAVIRSLYYLTLPILFNSLTSTKKTSLFLIALSISYILFIPFIFENISLVDLIGPLVFIFIFSPLVIVISFYRDLLEKDRMEDLQANESRLRKGLKMEAISKLSRGVAHDFNNILHIVGNFSNTIEQKALQENVDSTITNDCKEIQNAISIGSKLTKQLLKLGRNQEQEKKSLLNINSTILELKSMMKSLIRPNVKLNINLDENLGLIIMNQAQLDQLILNPVINSKEAITNKGEITLQTANIRINRKKVTKFQVIQPGDYVTLKIIDNGKGVDEQTMEHVFEPYYTTKEKGTGLGLSIVSSIVEQYNGYIDIISDVGIGTSIIFYFPVTIGKG